MRSICVAFDMNNLYFDNKDDKKEIFNLICHLTPEKRAAFLCYACKQVPSDLAKVMKPGKDSTWEPKEVFWQLMSLTYLHRMELKHVYVKLIEFVKKGKMD